MKKISTLFLALSVAVAALAVPRPNVTNKVVSLPTRTERVANPNHQVPAKTTWVEAAQRDIKPAALPAYKQAADNPQTMGTVSFNDIVGEDLTYEANWYNGYQAWYVVFSDGLGNYMQNYITLGIANGGKELNGVYTLDDCVSTWTGTNIQTEEIVLKEVLFDTVYINFNRTKEGLKIDGKFHAKDCGYLTLSYFEQFPKDTVNIVITNATIEHHPDTTWTVTGTTADKKYIASALVSGDKVVGSFDVKDMDKAQTFVAATTDADTVYHHIFGKDATMEGSVERDNYVMDLGMMGTDTIWYNVHFTSPLPPVKDTIEVAANNLSIDADLAGFIGIVFIAASNADYELSIMLKSATEPNGTYTVKDFQSSFLAQGEDIVGFIGGSIDIDYEANTVQGYLLGSDIKRYKLDLKFELPTAKDTVKVAFDQVKRLKFYYESDDYAIYYGNDEIGVQIDFFGDPEDPTGTYSLYEDESIDDYYTFVEQYMDGDTLYLETLDAAIEVAATDVDTVYAIKATILSEDTIAYVFTFKATYKYEEPVEGALEYDAQTGNLSKTYTKNDIAVFAGDDWKEDGVIYFQALALDDLRMLSLDFNTEDAVINGDTMPAAGVYPIDLSLEPGTVTASEGIMENEDGNAYISGAFTGILTEDYQISFDGLYFLVSGTVTVLYNDNKQIKIVVAAKNSYGLDIDITYDASATSAVENVDSNTSVSIQKVLRNGQVLILRGNKTYTVLGEEVK